MSERYEGVVFRADERPARRAFGALASGLRLRLVRLGRGVFGVYRVAGRSDTFDRPAVERVAELASAEAGKAVALFYDNGCSLRAGVLYAAGRRGREFGDGDAWWVPYGEDGELVLDGLQFQITELPPGGEYDCVFSAIDAALEALAAEPRVSSELIKRAFCYDELEPLAESGNRGRSGADPGAAGGRGAGGCPFVGRALAALVGLQWRPARRGPCVAGGGGRPERPMRPGVQPARPRPRQ
jgi:hypothetical protein